jgi:hypothetical protein
VLSHAIAKLRLEVPAAIENAFDEYRIRRDDEGNGHAPLESGHPQSGQEIVALRSPQRKCGQPVAEIDDAADIAVRAPSLACTARSGGCGPASSERAS